MKQAMITALIWSPVVMAMVFLYKKYALVATGEAAIFIVPGMTIELFILVSTWYICRAVPLDARNMANVVLKHLTAAFLMISFWLFVLYGYANGLDLALGLNTYSPGFDNGLWLLLNAGLFLYFLGILYNYLIILLERSHKAEQRAISSEVVAREAQLLAFKAFVNPHFLFNSLTALTTLITQAPEKANKLCLKLAGFLRYNLNYEQKKYVQVQDEINHVGNYLDIEKTRLGDRLNLVLDVEQKILKRTILPFSLIPLVENAIKHGIQKSVDGGTLELNIRSIDDRINIRVQNPAEPGVTLKMGEGRGLSALEKRLETEFGDAAELTFRQEGEFFTTCLEYPFISKEHHGS